MPLNNYANLIASIKSRSKRDDVSDADIEDYIDQTEAEMYNNAIEPLKIRAMESRQTASASTSSRYLELPTDYLGMRQLSIISGGETYDVDYRAPEQIIVKSGSGRPRFFTVTTQLEFDRVPDSAYTVEMRLFKKVAALSSANTTNDVLTLSPNIYLFGALWALFQDYREFDISEMYYQKFIGAISGLNKTDRRGRFGPNPRMRYEGSTP